MINIDNLIKIRRDLHKIPEIGNKEYKTSMYIKNYLDCNSISYVSVLDTGIIASVCGDKKGKNILIRADIDALPVIEDNNLEFVSQNKGFMHACGHDAHMAISLELLRYFNENKSELNGNLYVVFQPDEEGLGGAERIINSLEYKEFIIDYCLALHIEPTAKVGTIQIKNNTIMASPDFFCVEIIGKGGHGGCPENAINPIIVTSEIITELSKINDKYLDNSCKVSCCQINSGTTPNIIPDKVQFAGTARSYTNKRRDEVESLIGNIIKNICEKYCAKYKYDFVRLYPPVENDKMVTDIVRKAIHKVGNIKIDELDKSSMLGDDFSYFSQKYPSCYFKLGCGNDTDFAPLHSPEFILDEDCLEIGVNVLIQSFKDLQVL